MPVPSSFEDPKVNIRTKLSGLWVSIMFCYIYGDYFELYVPGKMVGLMTGKNMLDSPAKLLAAAVLLIVPICMIFVSLIVKPEWCRLLNIVFGIFFTVLMLLIGLTSFTPWLGFYVLFAFAEVVLTTLVVVCAIRWPRNI